MSGHFDEDLLQRGQRPVQSDGGAQCWICPHCFDDANHHSDAQGCGRKPEALIQIGPLDV
jgi:hypothetical protein